MVDIAQSIMDATGILIDKKLAQQRFDKTISATIIDNSQKEIGKYTVSNGSTSFDAYSVNGIIYNKNDSVMVTIPEGDYDKKKIILGKVAEEKNKVFSYKTSFDDILDMTGNLLAKENDRWIGFSANDLQGYSGRSWSWTVAEFQKSPTYLQGPIWQSIDQYYGQNFTAIGIQANFSTTLKELNVTDGTFGLVLEIIFLDLETNEEFSKFVTMDSSQFFGNIYNQDTYQKESKIFDISDLIAYPIVGFKIYPYQKCDFINTQGDLIPQQDTKNLFIETPYICLGFSTETFDKDIVSLTSLNSSTYSKETIKEGIDRDTQNKKDIILHWAHKQDGNVKMMKSVPDGYRVCWYQYDLGNPGADRFCGAHWKRLDSLENKFEYRNFQPDINSQFEQFKVIILKLNGDIEEESLIESNVLRFNNLVEVPNQETINTINALKILIEDNNKNGKYFIYNRAGQLNNSTDAGPYKLTPLFHEKIIQLLNDEDSLEWVFPEDNNTSMISPVFEKRNDNNEIIFQEDYENNKIFKTKTSGSMSINYNIKRTLNQSAQNNTIQLRVVKDGIRYETAVTLLFGTAGTSGSDYTVTIDWLEEQKYDKSLGLKLNTSFPLEGRIIVLDQSGNEVNIKNSSAEFLCEWEVSVSCEIGNDKEYPIEQKNLFYPVKFTDEDFNSAESHVEKPEGATENFYFNDKENLENNIFNNIEYYTFEPDENGIEGQGNYVPAAGYNKDAQYYRKKTNKEKKCKFTFERKSIKGYYYYYKTLDKEIDSNKIYYNYSDEDGYTIVQQPKEDELKNYYEYGYKNININGKVDYKEKTFFVRYGDRYIVDPWDGFQETETYYVPRLADAIPKQLQLLDCEIVEREDKYYISISKKEEDISMNSLFVLKLTLTKFGNYDLISYYPIPLTQGEVSYIEGPTTIRYSTNGEIDYNKNSYKAFDFNNNEITDGQWHLLYDGTETENDSDFLPSLTIENDNTYLNPPGIYFKDSPHYGVQFIKDSNVYWTQPIFVYQDNYPSTTLNKWNGKDIKTDNEQGTITANGFAAGRKERNNTFTGVVLGDWSRSDADEVFTDKQTGVFGFHEGVMSYALKDDGTAFFGKDGKGRIYLNGEKSQIHSALWKSKQTGMLIDLDDGYLHINNKKDDENRYITLSSQENDYPLSIGNDKNINKRKFRVNWDGTAYLEGEIIANSGKIGNWKLEDNVLEDTQIYIPKHDATASLKTDFIDLCYQTGLAYQIKDNNDEYINATGENANIMAKARIGKIVGSNGNDPTENYGLISNRSVFLMATTCPSTNSYINEDENNPYADNSTRGNVAVQAAKNVYISSGDRTKLDKNWIAQEIPGTNGKLEQYFEPGESKLPLGSMIILYENGNIELRCAKLFIKDLNKPEEESLKEINLNNLPYN